MESKSTYRGLYLQLLHMKWKVMVYEWRKIYTETWSQSSIHWSGHSETTTPVSASHVLEEAASSVTASVVDILTDINLEGRWKSCTPQEYFKIRGFPLFPPMRECSRKAIPSLPLLLLLPGTQTVVQHTIPTEGHDPEFGTLRAFNQASEFRARQPQYRGHTVGQLAS